MDTTFIPLLFLLKSLSVDSNSRSLLRAMLTDSLIELLPDSRLTLFCYIALNILRKVSRVLGALWFSKITNLSYLPL